MKIGRIDHIRCGEPAARTYVMVPSEMSQEDFAVAARNARAAYEDVMDTVPLYERGYVAQPDIGALRKLPADTTVKEVLDDYEARKAERAALDELADKKRRSFGWYLQQQGLQIVQLAEESVHADLDWGHRHGQKIRYDGIDFYDGWYEDDDGNEQCD